MPLEDLIAEDSAATLDRVSAIVPTTGYNANAPSEFFESTKGLIQPLALTANGNTGVYKVNSPVGTIAELDFKWNYRNAKFNNSLGYFITDSLGLVANASGTLVDPVDWGAVNQQIQGQLAAAIAQTTAYQTAALANAAGLANGGMIFLPGEKTGATETVFLPGGSHLVFFMKQDGATSPVWLRIGRLITSGFE